MKNMFSFFAFYKSVLKKDNKRYEIATNPNKHAITAMTPLIMFIVSMVSYTIIGGLPILQIILFITFMANFLILNHTRFTEYERIEKEKEEVERLAREELARKKFEEWLKIKENIKRMEREADKRRMERERLRQEEELRQKYQRQRQKEQQQQQKQNNNMSNAIKLLGLDENFTKDDVKKAYRKLSKIHHPDVVGGSAENFKRLNTAYNYIMDRI